MKKRKLNRPLIIPEALSKTSILENAKYLGKYLAVFRPELQEEKKETHTVHTPASQCPDFDPGLLTLGVARLFRKSRYIIIHVYLHPPLPYICNVVPRCTLTLIREPVHQSRVRVSSFSHMFSHTLTRGVSLDDDAREKRGERR